MARRLGRLESRWSHEYSPILESLAAWFTVNVTVITLNRPLAVVAVRQSGSLHRKQLNLFSACKAMFCSMISDLFWTNIEWYSWFHLKDIYLRRCSLKEQIVVYRQVSPAMELSSPSLSFPILRTVLALWPLYTQVHTSARWCPNSIWALMTFLSPSTHSHVKTFPQKVPCKTLCKRLSPVDLVRILCNWTDWTLPLPFQLVSGRTTSLSCTFCWCNYCRRPF